MTRTAVANFARQHREFLTAAGFTAIEEDITKYEVSSASAAGQRMLQNFSALQAARSAVVDHLRLVDGAEFDEQLQRCPIDHTPEMVGGLEAVNTIARKPRRWRRID